MKGPLKAKEAPNMNVRLERLSFSHFYENRFFPVFSLMSNIIFLPPTVIKQVLIL